MTVGSSGLEMSGNLGERVSGMAGATASGLTGKGKRRVYEIECTGCVLLRRVVCAPVLTLVSSQYWLLLISPARSDSVLGDSRPCLRC